MKQRHQEAHSTGFSVFALLSGSLALAFHELRDVSVELEFFAVNLEACCAGDALREDWFLNPLAILLFGEIDHGFFGAPEVEGGTLALHGFFNGFHIGVDIFVQKLQEEGEIQRVALVGRGCEKEDVVGIVAKHLA